jgi:hypothetical protein
VLLRNALIFLIRHYFSNYTVTRLFKKQITNNEGRKKQLLISVAVTEPFFALRYVNIELT